MLSVFLILSATADGRRSAWFLNPSYSWSSMTDPRSTGLGAAVRLCKKGGSMSKGASEKVSLELAFLEALDSIHADVDTSDIAEIHDWSRAVRGKFHGA